MTNVYWLEQFAADVPADNEWLSAAELARLQTMRFAKRRADWRLGRWTAHRAVASYLERPSTRSALAQVEIRPAPSGVPEPFLAGEPAPVVISLSHCDGIALCAVVAPGAALGCDLENVEPRSEAFLTDYFTREEQALVAQTTPAERSALITLLWSAKESALKALGEGLRLDTRSVIANPTVTAQSAKTWNALEVRSTGGQVFHGWWQRTGNLMRTMVCNPPPSPPIPLHLPLSTAARGRAHHA